MTHGSSMENPSGFGPAGIGIRACSLMVRELRLASPLGSASLAVLAGAGDTGDTIGITTIFVSTTTATSPTAEFLPIATASIAPADFMAEEREDSRAANMDSRHMAPTPARSAALTMAESREDSPLAGGRALAEASTA